VEVPPAEIEDAKEVSLADLEPGHLVAADLRCGSGLLLVGRYEGGVRSSCVV